MLRKYISKWLLETTVAFLLQIAVRAEHHSSPSNSNNGDASAAFCAGMPMAMFMDGFHWSLGVKSTEQNQVSQNRPPQPPQQCLNYLFDSWLLTSPDQFGGAMVFSFLLAIIMEAISAFRGWIIRTQSPNSSLRKYLLVIIYALQSLLGYVIMIVAMMYSLELFISVALGLAVGHLLFVRLLPERPIRTP